MVIIKKLYYDARPTKYQVCCSLQYTVVLHYTSQPDNNFLVSRTVQRRQTTVTTTRIIDTKSPPPPALSAHSSSAVACSNGLRYRGTTTADSRNCKLSNLLAESFNRSGDAAPLETREADGGSSSRGHVFKPHVTSRTATFFPCEITSFSPLPLTLRRLMSYIYMEHPFLMFLDHTQRRSTVGRTPLDE